MQHFQQNSLIYALRHLWAFLTQHRLFPLIYLLVRLFTVVPSSTMVYMNLSACEKSSWVITSTVATMIGDLLEMAVLVTTLIADADTAREVILGSLLPLMSFVKLLGKIAKTTGDTIIIGEFAAEMMLI